MVDQLRVNRRNRHKRGVVGIGDGRYLVVSVDARTRRLRVVSYIDNLVNLFVADELSDVPMDEVLRRADTDTVGRSRQVYRERPDPHFRTYGPKTRRGFLNLLKLTRGRIT